jgi:hypothetical protein
LVKSKKHLALFDMVSPQSPSTTGLTDRRTKDSPLETLSEMPSPSDTLLLKVTRSCSASLSPRYVTLYSRGICKANDRTSVCTVNEPVLSPWSLPPPKRGRGSYPRSRGLSDHSTPVLPCTVLSWLLPSWVPPSYTSNGTTIPPPLWKAALMVQAGRGQEDG